MNEERKKKQPHPLDSESESVHGVRGVVTRIIKQLDRAPWGGNCGAAGTAGVGLGGSVGPGMEGGK